MRKLAIALAIAATLTASPAYANHERSRCGGYDDGNGSADCSDYGGQGNHNRQDRHQGRDDNHKAFSPDLKDSPTTLYFCLPGSTCNFGDSDHQDDKGGDKREPAPER